MATPEITDRDGAFARARLLGTIGMIMSPMLALGPILFQDQPDQPNHPLETVLGLLFLGGWACSAVGMRLVRATGGGTPGRVVFAVQMIGLLLAAIFNLLELVRFDQQSPLWAITDAAWPLSVVFMIVVGLLTLRAGIWRGWRRLTPLLCGLSLPLAFAVSAAAGAVVGEAAAGPAMLATFGLFTTVAWLLLGYAVRTSDRALARSSRPGV